MTFAELKQRVYVMRNGVLADQLRAAGCPYRLIWGVSLPQIKEIARENGYDRDAAMLFFGLDSLRENFLTAVMLFPPDGLGRDDVAPWLDRMRWSEDADVLTHTLLLGQPYADEVAEELTRSDDRLRRYAGLRLYLGLVQRHPVESLAAARREAERPDALSNLAAMLADEATFWSEQD